MITTTDTIDDIKKAKRWVISLGYGFAIDEEAKTVTLQRSNLEDSLQKLVAYADRPPRKHGLFYLADLTRKQRELCEQSLDDRFILVG